MSLDRNGIIESVGIMTVVLSLLFVAYEIRQSNEIAIGTTVHELNRNWMSINELIITSPELLSLLVEIADKNYVPKDERELQRSLAYARRLLNHWVSVEEAYRNSIVSDAYYSMTAEDVIKVINNRPGLLPIYKIIASSYDLSQYDLLRPILLNIEE